MTSKKYSMRDINDAAATLGFRCISNDYKSVKDKIELECLNGHLFEKRVQHFMYSKTGCPHCAGRGRGVKQDISFFKNYAKERGGKCLTINYVGASQKIFFECKYGHVFSKTAGYCKHHGSWCPECSDPKGEAFARSFCEETTGLKFKKVRPDWLRYKRNLELDMFCEDELFAIEYDGPHHFHAIEFMGGEDSLKIVAERDAFKDRRCAEEGVLLMRVASPRSGGLGPIKKSIEKAACDQCIPYRINPEFVEMMNECIDTNINQIP